MIAFGHNILFDYKQSNIQEKAYPQLFLSANKNKELNFNHSIEYNQNQNREVILTTNGSFKENIDKQGWSFNIKNVVSFVWEKGSSTVYYHLEVDNTHSLLEYWFLHTLMPIFLTIEGKYEFIHAGSVEINKKAVLFIAPSFGGKSTLTNYFIQKNHPMLSDDKIGISLYNNRIQAISSYPYHRPYRKMEDLGLSVENFTTKQQNLHVIYSLQRADSKAEIKFTELYGIEKFKALQYNFDFKLPLNRSSSFNLIAKLASLVPLYNISVPWDMERLNEVYSTICKHSESIN